jgi:hypothetical protein
LLDRSETRSNSLYLVCPSTVFNALSSNVSVMFSSVHPRLSCSHGLIFGNVVLLLRSGMVRMAKKKQLNGFAYLNALAISGVLVE